MNPTARRIRPTIHAAVLLIFLLPAMAAEAQTLEQRITSLLAQMTTEEKIKQLHHEGGFNTPDNTRLGIPGFVMADGPHGVRDGLATSFPVGIGMASTWDPSLARQIGAAMGREFLAKGKHQGLGPCLDIDRDPRNGRTPETGGEDPFLCARITTAVVQGMQSASVIATVKHYNANHRENGRTSNNIVASQSVLHDIGGLPFRAAVQEGGALSVMNAYNLINGDKCAESGNLLTTILRDHWGFPYYVVSDWGSIWSSEKAIKAGCDVCMGSDNYQNDLPSLVGNGTVSIPVLDAAVRRVLRTKLVAGMLDDWPQVESGVVNSAAHQQLSLEAGRKSLVLLKNEGNILPLSKALTGYVALIGPSANVLQIDGSGSAYVSPFYTVTPRQGIEQIIGAGRVQYVKGCDINSADTTGFAAAVSAARNADAVVYCGGLDQTQEGEGYDRVGGSIDLPGVQQNLINALAAANPRLVAVLFSGGICGIDRSVNSMQGLIQAFYPGQEGGKAVAEVLFGDVNPGGKLPVTYARTDAQLPPWNDNLNDDFGCGYRWFDQMGTVPLFPFGHGLSYTAFGYSNLAVQPASAAPGEPVTVSFDVRNTGVRAGDEVAQLYLTYLSGPDIIPPKQLKSFQRVTIPGGQTARVSLTLTADEFYTFNEGTSRYEVKPGTYRIGVGGSSSQLPLSATFEITDGLRKPDLLITGVRTVPPHPQPGEKVLFLAAVKNQGSAPVQGAVIKTNFSVNGTTVCWSDDFSGLIPAGGMALLCGNTGPADTSTWTAGPIGSYTVGATVDPEQSVDECVETNNSITAELSVVPAQRANLALHRGVSVTSVEGAGLEGPRAVDGNMGTRWSSAFTDPQVLIVDLGGSYFIDDVVIYWEAAFAREYYLKIGSISGPWLDVKHEQNGNGGVEVIPVGAVADRVMMAGVQRGSPYGYSIYELQVHGSSATDVGLADGAIPSGFFLSQAFPNPFNPTTTLRYQLPVAARTTIGVYDLLGREIKRLVEEQKEAGSYSVTFDATGTPSGALFCRMTAEPAAGGPGYSHVTKLLVLK